MLAALTLLAAHALLTLLTALLALLASHALLTLLATLLATLLTLFLSLLATLLALALLLTLLATLLALLLALLLAAHSTHALLATHPAGLGPSGRSHGQGQGGSNQADTYFVHLCAP